MTFKNPVPDDRTIVSGFWSDLLDNFLASFDIDSDGVVTLKTQNTTEDIYKPIDGKMLEALESINHELRLLNIRFEETFRTSINSEDAK